ncbi:MAG: transposase zinc-binding domain-containing protein [Acidobacteria bacterium]|nr:transposase zinc-binding domain-containing protein [Acidobacteriota bacterium]
MRAHGAAYRRAHRLARVQTLALRAIAACRTALLGGRRETCDHCGATRLTYNSCRNRHCPTCQAHASALLRAPTPPAIAGGKPVADLDPTRCPVGRQGHWHVVEILRPLVRALAPAALDTS